MTSLTQDDYAYAPLIQINEFVSLTQDNQNNDDLLSTNKTDDSHPTIKSIHLALSNQIPLNKNDRRLTMKRNKLCVKNKDSLKSTKLTSTNSLPVLETINEIETLNQINDLGYLQDDCLVLLTQSDKDRLRAFNDRLVSENANKIESRGDICSRSKDTKCELSATDSSLEHRVPEYLPNEEINSSSSDDFAFKYCAYFFEKTKCFCCPTSIS